MKCVIVVALASLLASVSQISAQTPLASLGKEARVGIDVRNVDTHRIEAVVRKDAAVLERLYGDDYVSTDSEGGTWTKSQELQTSVLEHCRSHRTDSKT
jgi:hypothetical protein